MARDIEWLKAEVLREFGEDLSRATPANVRQFCIRLSQELEPPHEPGEPWELDTSHRDKGYVDSLQSFYREVLNLPPEQAVVHLWLRCMELDFVTAADAMKDYYVRYFGDQELDED